MNGSSFLISDLNTFHAIVQSLRYSFLTKLVYTVFNPHICLYPSISLHYCTSKKTLFCNFLYKMGKDFLDTQYTTIFVSYRCVRLKDLQSMICLDSLNAPVSLFYRAFYKLLKIYTANHATFPIQMKAITVYICGNF